LRQQLVFVVTMFMAAPDLSDVTHQMLHPPMQAEFLYLIAANIGSPFWGLDNCNYFPCKKKTCAMGW